MKGYEPGQSFASAEAAALHDQRGDEDAAVEFLAQRARGGPALELAIGTGRIALPLAARGIDVQGIDIAPAMVERLRENPGGEALSVQIGDFADVAVSGRFPLVFVVWNTFFNLLTQDEQIRCFENVAAHLTDDGLFVIEAYVPAYLYRLPEEQQVRAESIAVDEVRIGVLQHDAASQTIEESHVTLSAAGTRLNPVVQRYAWPSEIDLMARLAGLRLVERHGGWEETPFESLQRPEPRDVVIVAGTLSRTTTAKVFIKSASELHVSVYGR